MLRHTFVAQEIKWKIVSTAGLKHEGKDENSGRHI